MEKLAVWISEWFVRKNYIHEADSDKIRFALEVVLSNSISFLTILILGIVFRKYVYTAVFVVSFIGFRTMRDRFHADQFGICFLLTVGSYLICIFMPEIVLDQFKIMFFLYLLIFNMMILLYCEVCIPLGKRKSIDYRFVIGLSLYNGIAVIPFVFDNYDFAILMSLISTIITVTSVDYDKDYLGSYY